VEHARLIRRVHFVATHHYGDPGADEGENRRRFGDQVEPHTHRWTVEVQVVGPVDSDTGWLTDLVALDEALDDITGRWDGGGDLNALIPEVASGEMQPSTENLARWLYERLAPRVDPPAVLDQVRFFESDDLGAAYPA
jgi:6-pyruvoyltetrahydropterin/6-carboxytetrahydropterin synthase